MAERRRSTSFRAVRQSSTVPSATLCDGRVCNLEIGGEMSVTVAETCLRQHNLVIGEKLGEGANGGVYFACANEDKCDRVVKVSNYDRREVDIARYLGALGIGPQIFDAFTCFSFEGEDVQFLVMEKVDYTLNSYFYQHKLTAEDADNLHLLFVRAFEAGLLHLDMKPDNVGIDLGNPIRWKLLDFGASYCVPINGPVFKPRTWFEGGAGLLPASRLGNVAASWDQLSLYASIFTLFSSMPELKDFLDRFREILMTYGYSKEDLADPEFFLDTILPARGLAVFSDPT